MLNKYKIAPTKEQSIRRIVGSMFLMVFGIYMVCLFNKTIGMLSIIISTTIFLFHMYFLLIAMNSLSALEIKVTAGRPICKDEIPK